MECFGGTNSIAFIRSLLKVDICFDAARSNFLENRGKYGFRALTFNELQFLILLKSSNTFSCIYQISSRSAGAFGDLGVGGYTQLFPLAICSGFIVLETCCSKEHRK